MNEVFTPTGVNWELFAASVGFILFQPVQWIVAYRLWTGRLDLYERSSIFYVLGGDRGKDGVTAGSCLLLTFGPAHLGALIGAMLLLGIRDADDVPGIAVIISITFASIPMSVIMYLFLWPKFLVPPHLRGGRGLLGGPLKKGN